MKTIWCVGEGHKGCEKGAVKNKCPHRAHTLHYQKQKYKAHFTRCHSISCCGISKRGFLYQAWTRLKAGKFIRSAQTLFDTWSQTNAFFSLQDALLLSLEPPCRTSTTAPLDTQYPRFDSTARLVRGLFASFRRLSRSTASSNKIRLHFLFAVCAMEGTFLLSWRQSNMPPFSFNHEHWCFLLFLCPELNCFPF